LSPSKCRGARGFRRVRRSSSARPPEKKPKKRRFAKRSQRHAKLKKQQWPYVDGGKCEKKAGEDRPRRHGQLRPTAGRTVSCFDATLASQHGHAPTHNNTFDCPVLPYG